MQGSKSARAEVLIRQHIPMSGIVTVDEAFVYLTDGCDYFFITHNEVRHIFTASDNFTRVQPNEYRRVG